METFTIREAAERCGKSYEAIRRRVARGTLEAVEQDGQTRVSRAALSAAGLLPDEPSGGQEHAGPPPKKPSGGQEHAGPPPKKPSGKRGTGAPAPTRESIAARAHEIYQAEGGGDEVEHWLRAEHELSSGKS